VLGRAALLALLVYVTLDLSLPAMPGAFVFEADASVESVHSARGRVVTALDTTPNGQVRSTGGCSSVRIDIASTARMLEAAAPPRPTHHLPRATLAPTTLVSASALEDPH
jgi:hypothetical protein